MCECQLNPSPAWDRHCVVDRQTLVSPTFSGRPAAKRPRFDTTVKIGNHDFSNQHTVAGDAKGDTDFYHKLC